MDIFNIYLPIAGIQFNALLLVCIGFCVGVLGGFFGVGGAWIVTPALNIFGFPMAYAIGTDLAHIFGKSIIATKKHSRMGNVDWKLGLIACMGSVIGVELGKQLVMALEKVGNVDTVVRWVYIILLFGLGAFMFYDFLILQPKVKREKEKATASGVEPTIRRVSLSHKFQKLNLPPMISLPTSGIQSISIWIIIGIFIVTGFLAGFLGVGGGFIRMPSMIYLIGCPTAVAVGTDLFEVMISAAYGCFTYGISGRVEIIAALVMLMGAAIGAQIGVEAVKYIRGYGIRILFASMIILAAISVAMKQAETIFHVPILGTLSGWFVMLAAGSVTMIIFIRMLIKRREEKMNQKLFNT
ncbi:MAG: putative rane transporter protein [Ignavibacteria bacterium]|nr:putative rane transporter protein [Ignavibacteria bacterium]